MVWEHVFEHVQAELVDKGCVFRPASEPVLLVKRTRQHLINIESVWLPYISRENPGKSVKNRGRFYLAGCFVDNYLTFTCTIYFYVNF